MTPQINKINLHGNNQKQYQPAIGRNERIISFTDFHQKPDCIPLILFEEEGNPDKK